MTKAMKVLRNLSVALAVMLAACSIDGHYGNGDDNYFSAFASMPDTRWDYASPLTFAVDTLRDSVARRGDMLLTVRHTHGYEYRNLWLEIDYDVADSLSRPDTVNVILADVYGHWRGHGSGPSLQVVDTLAHGVALRRGQQIRVRHIMRLDTLPGIEQVGITFLPRETL